MQTECHARAVGRTRRLAAAAAIGLALFSSSAVAQGNRVIVTLDFAFIAAGKEMPAGSYALEAASGKVTVQPRSGKEPPVILPIITRLGRHDNDADAELIFDKLDGRLHLSELWVPGIDGYLLLATAKEHDHAVHGGSRPRK